MARKKIIAGNWKMHFTPAKAIEFTNKIKDSVNTNACDVVFCVPYINLQPVADALAGTHIKVGAQNMHYRDEGACTGEISGLMLKEIGIPYAIIGHSERRAGFGDTDTTVNMKTLKAVEHGITPIICVGELLKHRKAGITPDLLRRQTMFALMGVPAEAVAGIVIAYEPIWAIGTGETATNEQAEEACGLIRGIVGELYGANTADAIRIQYGGSVNAENAGALFSMPNIDGGLVGGASIQPSFERIVNFG
jgi:triosephosphate isomerase